MGIGEIDPGVQYFCTVDHGRVNRGCHWVVLQAVAPEVRGGAFPPDAYWQEVLGVDLSRVEEGLADREALLGWLARQSDALLALLEERVGLAPTAGRKRDRAARLLESEAGRAAVRQAVICRQYLVNRRKEALEKALGSVIAARPFLSGLGAARGDWVRVALEVAAGAPECLLWFDLWDRALRVGYREYRPAGGGVSADGVSAEADASTAAGGPTESAERVALEPGRLDKETVQRAIRRGFSGTSLHCVDVVPHPSGAESLVFLLHESESKQRVQTWDGVRHVRRLDWIILRLAEQGRRLWVHSRGEIGVRVAEAIVAEAAGAGPVAYRPHRPRTDRERIARWAEELARRDGEEIRLDEVDLILPEAPGTTWSIQGDVVVGLELIGRAAQGGRREDGSDSVAAPPAVESAATAVGSGRDKTAESESAPGEPDARAGVAAAVLSAARLTRVSLGFRENSSRRWSTFTLWVHPGEDDNAFVVSYRAYGASTEERRAFLSWMTQHGIRCTPV